MTHQTAHPAPEYNKTTVYRVCVNSFWLKVWPRGRSDERGGALVTVTAQMVEGQTEWKKGKERKQMERHKKKLKNEQRRFINAHWADAVPPWSTCETRRCFQNANRIDSVALFAPLQHSAVRHLCTVSPTDSFSGLVHTWHHNQHLYHSLNCFQFLYHNSKFKSSISEMLLLRVTIQNGGHFGGWGHTEMPRWNVPESLPARGVMKIKGSSFLKGISTTSVNVRKCQFSYTCADLNDQWP